MEPGLENIKRNIYEVIQEEVHRLGIHCKIFARVKDISSLREKILRRKRENNNIDYYTTDGRHVQDIIGIRLVTYFYEDVDLLWNICKKKFVVVNESVLKMDTKNFEPLRKNMVCQMLASDSSILDEIKHATTCPEYQLSDNTFEIQFRTTLSEGWHEVDHVLRYKSKEDWEDFLEEERMFNGIYAALETSDRTMKALFDDIAFKHYKNRNWSALLRTKFRLHFFDKSLSDQVITYLNEDKNLSKKIYKCDRNDIMAQLASVPIKFKLTTDNFLFYLVYTLDRTNKILGLAPENIMLDFKNYIQ